MNNPHETHICKSCGVEITVPFVRDVDAVLDAIAAPEWPRSVEQGYTPDDWARDWDAPVLLAASATDEQGRLEERYWTAYDAAFVTDEGLYDHLTPEELVILPRMRLDLKRFDAFRREDVEVLLDIIDRLDRRLRARPAVPALGVERLARALFAVHAYPTLDEARELARDIAREYAALPSKEPTE